MSLALEKFISEYEKFSSFGQVQKHADVQHKHKTYPLLSVRYGAPNAPTLLITGGVHGLERIGAQLALSLLESFHQRLQWDLALHELLKKIQVVFVPLVNPVGYFEVTRSNANGVDIMRNAPIEATDKVPFLLGGHQFSSKLAWYRGTELQTESDFLIQLVNSILQKTNCLISLDIHSGFGLKDQLWFPFANSRKQFTQINEMFLLFELYEKSNPHHIYKIEPQSKNYLTHGDIWDYCFYNFKQQNQVYLPLTLEMGSWIWVKKNPLQLFSKTGLFNPIKEHRMKRTFRRHRPFFDFLLHALYTPEAWTSPTLIESLQNSKIAAEKYYGT